MTGAAAAWPATEAALDAVLDRRWYTNHGPAAEALERLLRQRLGVPYAVVAANPTVAALMTLEALDLDGSVQLAAGVPGWCVAAVRWAGLDPVECGAPGWLQPGTSAVMLGADAGGLRALAAGRGIPVIRVSAGANAPGPEAGPVVLQLPCPCDPAGLGCVLTGDAELAARLRNIRSSYGAGPPVPVARTANGRVSEIQAAMALLALDPDGWHGLRPGEG